MATKKKVTLSLEDIGDASVSLDGLSNLEMPFTTAFLISENTRFIGPVYKNYFEKRAAIVRENAGDKGVMTLNDLNKVEEFVALSKTEVEIEFYPIEVYKLSKCVVPPGLLSSLSFMFYMEDTDVAEPPAV